MKYVTIHVRPPLGVLGGGLTKWQHNTVPQVIENEYSRLLNKTVRIMKQEAPRRSGFLANSISIKTKTTTGGRRDRRYHGRVGPTAKYAQFVERGTGSSPGAFIPSIEKRIRSGTHPGTPKNPFVQRTLNKVESLAQGHAKNIGREAKARFRIK